MTPGLIKTLVGSFALAGLLNVIQMTADFNSQAKATFAPKWADATAVKSASGAATAAKTASTLAPTITPAATPATDPAVQIQAKLTAAHLKPDFASNYLRVQQQTGTPWQLLAAVHQVETGQSDSTARSSSAGATGPMQFMPATFRAYALDGDANGTKDITDLDDALLSAGNYLRAGGADKGRYAAALYNYNHSYAYVTSVMTIARRLGL